MIKTYFYKEQNHIVRHLADNVYAIFFKTKCSEHLPLFTYCIKVSIISSVVIQEPIKFITSLKTTNLLLEENVEKYLGLIFD